MTERDTDSDERNREPTRQGGSDGRTDRPPTARTDEGPGPDPAGGTAESTDGGGADAGSDLPEEAVDEAERLTRLAREAVDDAEREAYREERRELLAEHGYTARVRPDDPGDVLVCHPAEWVVEGTVRTDRIEDIDRAVERPLSGPGDPDRWEQLDRHNRELAAAVREAHGDVHGDNADAFADFMGNHYARPVEEATGEQIREFLEEYFPRNAWPSDRQQAVVGRSLELLFERANEEIPEL